MHYTKELDMIIENSLQELIELKKRGEGPFKPNVVNEYFNKFKEIEKSKEEID